MAVAIRLELSETALAVNPGGAVTTRCTVYNASFIVDEYRLTVSGVDSSWVEVPAATSRIFPEAMETVAVTFRPPRSSNVAAGDYPFVVTATSVDNPATSAAVNGTLTVDPFVDYAFDLVSPRQASGEIESEFKVRLNNTGNSPLEIALDAAEETGQLGFDFSEQTVSVAGNQSRDVTVTARVGQGGIGNAAAYQITIGASITMVAGASSSVADRRTLPVMFQVIPGVSEPPELAPQRVELAGQHAQTQLILKNRSAVDSVISLAATDKAQALTYEFVGGDRVTVPARGSLNVPIRITCLDRTLLAPPPATTYYTVTVTPIQPSGDARTVMGELALPSPADFRLRLEPEVVESTVNERVQLTVENVSGRAGEFVLSAASKDASLGVSLGTTRVEVPARDRVTVPVELAPNAEAMSAAATGRPSGYTIHVEAADNPAHFNDVSGQYVFTPAAITMRVRRKEIESVAEATFDVEVENTGKGEVSVALSASDRAGACAYSFDLPRIRIAGRSTAIVQLTVTPPKEHKADAQWEFTVEARPVSPPGSVVRDTGLLIYRSATVSIALSPLERRGRRPRKFDVVTTNPTNMGMTVKMAARDHSGGLGISLKKDTVKLEPAQSAKVGLKATPRKRSRGSGEASLTFNVVATPISPPGDAATIEGTFVALPARSRLIYLALLLLLFVAYLFSPFYEKTFYLAGWKHQRVFIVQENGVKQRKTVSGKHTITKDMSCVFHHVLDSETGQIISGCYAQGPKNAIEVKGTTQ